MIPHRIYVGTIGQGLWRSTDGGESFVRASDGMFVECHVRALAIHPQAPRTLFLGSEQGLFRSDDGADRWTRVESPLNGLQLWSILLLPHRPEVVVVGPCPSRLFVSHDAGRSWFEPQVGMVQDCPRIMATRVTTLVADPTEPATIWAGVEIDGVYRSRDEGRTWAKLPVQGLTSQDIHSLVLVPEKRGGKRILVSTNRDMNASIDDGESWNAVGIGQSLPWAYCRALAQPCGRPEVILLGNGDGPPGSSGIIAHSKDGGRTWKEATMPHRANSTIWNFAVHAADADLIYASSVSGQLYRSTDGGETWAKLPREFGEVRALAWAS